MASETERNVSNACSLRRPRQREVARKQKRPRAPAPLSRNSRARGRAVFPCPSSERAQFCPKKPSHPPPRTSNTCNLIRMCVLMARDLCELPGEGLPEKMSRARRQSSNMRSVPTAAMVPTPYPPVSIADMLSPVLASEISRLDVKLRSQRCCPGITHSTGAAQVLWRRLQLLIVF